MSGWAHFWELFVRALCLCVYVLKCCMCIYLAQGEVLSWISDSFIDIILRKRAMLYGHGLKMIKVYSLEFYKALMQQDAMATAKQCELYCRNYQRNWGICLQLILLLFKTQDISSIFTFREINTFSQNKHNKMYLWLNKIHTLRCHGSFSIYFPIFYYWLSVVAIGNSVVVMLEFTSSMQSSFLVDFWSLSVFRSE